MTNNINITVEIFLFFFVLLNSQQPCGKQATNAGQISFSRAILTLCNITIVNDSLDLIFILLILFMPSKFSVGKPSSFSVRYKNID